MMELAQKALNLYSICKIHAIYARILQKKRRNRTIIRIFVVLLPTNKYEVKDGQV